MKQLIHRATIINDGESYVGSILIDGERIAKIYRGEKIYKHEAGTRIDTGEYWFPEGIEREADVVIPAEGLLLLPGCIDDQVHFREPGLTHKATIESESRAAVAGGITSFMEMPNTKPPTTSLEAWQWKMDRAQETSWANYSFFFGGSNDNADELRRIDRLHTPGIKLFLGSSTGNMLVDDRHTLERIFSETDLIITTHCEKEEIIRANREHFLAQIPEDELDVRYHPLIRSEEACYRSSSEAVELATRLGSRLHILHVSTARELSLFSDQLPLAEKRITAEACVHHLLFTDQDYPRLGNRIKWNPAVKTMRDREALREAVRHQRIDIIATDHAPHLLEEKKGNCLTAASGGPLCEWALISMLDLALEGVLTREQVVEMMAHRPAQLFGIQDRGFIREDYYADLVLIAPNAPHLVTADSVVSKCGWSPFEGHIFTHRVVQTFVNGHSVYHDGAFCPDRPASHPLTFGR